MSWSRYVSSAARSSPSAPPEAFACLPISSCRRCAVSSVLQTWIVTAQRTATNYTAVRKEKYLNNHAGEYFTAIMQRQSVLTGTPSQELETSAKFYCMHALLTAASALRIEERQYSSSQQCYHTPKKNKTDTQ